MPDPHTSTPFSRRHIGVDGEETARMLRVLGCASVDELLREVIPGPLLSTEALCLEPALDEAAALARARRIADSNRPMRSYIGEGYYGTHTPAVIVRNVIENPSWYTSYTPYQPEVAQGRLEALMLYQTMIADLTGLKVANASLLDEATACAEALALCLRANTAAPKSYFVDERCLPQCIAVVRTRAAAAGVDVVVGPRAEACAGGYGGVLLRYPDVDGCIYDFSGLAERAHQRGALVAVATDLLALTMLTEPAALGADIAVGSAQRFGTPMACGGPHAGFIACGREWAHMLPGRLVALAKDAGGRRAYRLALQSREQHIGRENATSNICTAQTLTAVMAAFYATWHGPGGLRAMAERAHNLAATLAGALERLGFSLRHRRYFDTLAVECGSDAGAVVERAARESINLRDAGGGLVGVSFDEATRPGDMRDVLLAFCPDATRADAALDDSGKEAAEVISGALARQSRYLEHPCFHRFRSETEMMRYMRGLARRDIGLDTGMIPLGTSTMKLNASAEMEPLSWPGFATVHPHAPLEQRRGYCELVGELERDLREISGFDAVSVQPNAGSQGELAGILAVKAYLAARGEARRSVCLIPQSAHGTNPASAAMCGLRVEVVACDQAGNIDIGDLGRLLGEHRGCVALAMITYPSTHGVFEERITEVCDLVHEAGGQVYLDGANMNAMVGICRPGRFGCDVAQLNLHKTFSVPHGGGGPGAGPVCVRRHLAPFLPGSPYGGNGDAGGARAGAVAGAEWGNAGILPVSWSYIRMMGGDGLRRATEAAIVSANYIAERLRGGFVLLYSNSRGRVAHECVFDIRPFRASAGIDVEDVAKRLIDYGFHPPRISLSVPGTMMIEPTESECQAEIDRFVDAMLSIRAEIADIEAGHADRADNVLKNAPHSLEALLATDWTHPYSREQAAYPLPSLRKRKHWPRIGRIDQSESGDLRCSMPAED